MCGKLIFFSYPLRLSTGWNNNVVFTAVYQTRRFAYSSERHILKPWIALSMAVLNRRLRIAVCLSNSQSTVYPNTNQLMLIIICCCCKRSTALKTTATIPNSAMSKSFCFLKCLDANWYRNSSAALNGAHNCLAVYFWATLCNKMAGPYPACASEVA